ncbi:G-protein alpha subunit [Mycena floridula]|nr:G-protein alpha subunit [Mycena floridula]
MPSWRKSSTPEPLEVNPFIHRAQIPPDETEQERAVRVRTSRDAQKKSRQIDESILESKKILDRRKKAVKILLLGQSEGGKSSVVKNFQMAFTPKQLDKERMIWKRIIHLNLISSVKVILLTLQEDIDPSTPSYRPLKRLLISLSPLLSVKTDLSPLPERMFGDGFDRPGTSLGHHESDRDDTRRNIAVVRGASGWKSQMTALAQAPEQNPSSHRAAFQASRHDPSPMLEAPRDDIITLWSDPFVQQMLARRKIRLESIPGFFLDDVSRIASSEYIPTNHEIVRARVSTLGMEEHHMIVEKGPNKGSEFYIIDVAGIRSARASWVPFFDDVQAILFIAPLVFHQMLEEDPRVNRLEDSMISWKEICANSLLANCALIVFFNKMDILKATIEAGVKVNYYVPSYGDNPNEVAHVTKYFRDRFRYYHKRLSPKPRGFLCYETSAIDTRATMALVVAVQEGILRRHLEMLTL